MYVVLSMSIGNISGLKKEGIHFYLWFSVVCTLIDEYVSAHCGPKFDHCDDTYSSNIRVQTTLNHIWFVHSMKVHQRKGCKNISQI